MKTIKTIIIASLLMLPSASYAKTKKEVYLAPVIVLIMALLSLKKNKKETPVSP